MERRHNKRTMRRTHDDRISAVENVLRKDFEFAREHGDILKFFFPPEGKITKIFNGQENIKVGLAVKARTIDSIVSSEWI